MIKHIVCFKLKDNSDFGKAKAKEVLMSMEGKVPQIKGIQVGCDFLGSSRSFDVILEVLLESNKVSEIISQNLELKGEMVLVIEGCKVDSALEHLNNLSILEHYTFYLNQNIESKEAMKKVAKDRGISKSDVYKEVVSQK